MKTLVSTLLGFAVFILGDYLAYIVYPDSPGLAVTLTLTGLVGGIIFAAAWRKYLGGPSLKEGQFKDSDLMLQLPPYPEIAMIGVAEYMGGEDDPTIRVAIFPHDIDPGQADSRLTGYANLGYWRARVFGRRGSGCGIRITDNRVAFTEPGLQGLEGRNCSFIRARRVWDGDCLLIVWKNGVVDVKDDDIDYIGRRVSGLVSAFV